MTHFCSSCIPGIKFYGGHVRYQQGQSGIFYPKTVFLNLDDDDEGTLNLVSQFTDTYLTCLTRQSSENELECGDAGDSSSSDTDSNSGCVNVSFELRDKDSDVQRFRDSGCGCRLDEDVLLSTG